MGKRPLGRAKLNYDETLDFDRDEPGHKLFSFALNDLRSQGQFAWGINMHTGGLIPRMPLTLPEELELNGAFVSHVASMRAFESEGFNVVTVGPEMERAFSDTLLDKVPLKLIKAPWRCFYLNLLDSDLMAWGGEVGSEIIKDTGFQGTGWHKVSGAYVIMYGGQIHIHYCSHPNERSVNSVDSAQGWFGFSYCYNPQMIKEAFQMSMGEKAYLAKALHETYGEMYEKYDMASFSSRAHYERMMGRSLSTLSMEGIQSFAQCLRKEIDNPTGPVDGTVSEDLYQHLTDCVDSLQSGELIPKEGNLEQWLQDCVSNDWNDASDWDVDDSEVRKANREMMTKLFRVVLNAILYMNAPSADLRKTSPSNGRTRPAITKKAKKMLAQASKMSGRPARRMRRRAERELSKVRKLGYKTIFLGPNIEETIAKAKRSGNGLPIKGHVRKGHWHLYYIGPKKDKYGNRIPDSERDQIEKWIPPTWCGDLSNLAKPKNYEFVEPAVEESLTT